MPHPTKNIKIISSKAKMFVTYNVFRFRDQNEYVYGRLYLENDKHFDKYYRTKHALNISLNNMHVLIFCLMVLLESLGFDNILQKSRKRKRISKLLLKNMFEITGPFILHQARGTGSSNYSLKGLKVIYNYLLNYQHFVISLKHHIFHLFMSILRPCVS